MLDPTENMEAISMWLFHIAKLTIHKYASMFCKGLKSGSKVTT